MALPFATLTTAPTANQTAVVEVGVKRLRDDVLKAFGGFDAVEGSGHLVEGKAFETYWHPDDAEEIVYHLALSSDETLRQRACRIEGKFAKVERARQEAKAKIELWGRQRKAMEAQVRERLGPKDDIVEVAMYLVRGYAELLAEAPKLKKDLGEAVANFNAVQVEREWLRDYAVNRKKQNNRERGERKRQRMEKRKDFLKRNGLAPAVLATLRNFNKKTGKEDEPMDDDAKARGGDDTTDGEEMVAYLGPEKDRLKSLTRRYRKHKVARRERVPTNQ